MQHWACSLEKHQNGGNHCHVALRLAGPKRWKSLKESIISSEGIVVNFSDQHDNYHSAYRYICKEDTSVHHSKHYLIWKIYPPHELRSQQKLKGLSQSRVHQSHPYLWHSYQKSAQILVNKANWACWFALGNKTSKARFCTSIYISTKVTVQTNNF